MKRTLCLRLLALAALLFATPALAAPADQMLVVRIELPAAEAPGLYEELAEWIDVWSHHSEPGDSAQKRTVLARVTPDELAAVRASGLIATVDAERTARLRALEAARRVREKAAADTAVTPKTIPGFPCYRTVEETYATQAQLAERYPRLARVVDFGDSWDKETAGGPGGYDLRALVLTNRDSPHPKAPFVVEAAIHAREYTTAELALRWAEGLLEDYGPGPGSDRLADATWLLDHTEIHVITPLNPDGRKKAEEGILWRKNVDNRFCTDNQLRGVDLNRNSPYFWGGGGTSPDQCSQIFPGDGPASEPETQALHAYLATVFDDQRAPDLAAPAPLDTVGAYLSLHSFGRFIVGPDWGGGAVPPNQDGILTLIRNVSSLNGYNVIPNPNATTGMTIDTAYGDHGVPAMLIELGTEFFEACSVFEGDILPRNLPVLTYYAKTAQRPYRQGGPLTSQVAVSSRSVPRGQPVEVTATVEGSGGVRGAVFTVDELPLEARGPREMVPQDGAWNGQSERVRAVVDTYSLEPGWHQVLVQGTDGAGEAGVPTAVWIEVRDAGPVVNKPYALPGGEIDPGETTGAGRGRG